MSLAVTFPAVVSPARRRAAAERAVVAEARRGAELARAARRRGWELYPVTETTTGNRFALVPHATNAGGSVTFVDTLDSVERHITKPTAVELLLGA